MVLLPILGEFWGETNSITLKFAGQLMTSSHHAVSHIQLGMNVDGGDIVQQVCNINYNIAVPTISLAI